MLLAASIPAATPITAISTAERRAHARRLTRPPLDPRFGGPTRPCLGRPRTPARQYPCALALVSTRPRSRFRRAGRASRDSGRRRSVSQAAAFERIYREESGRVLAT